jgi:hypothetical protein
MVHDMLFDRDMPDTPLSGGQSAQATNTAEDRRAFRRAQFDRPVMIETDVESQSGKALNVSAGGIALETTLDLAPGSDVGVYFELPIGYAVETRATVVRRQGAVVALRFNELAHEAVVALRSFAKISGLHQVPKH